LEGARGLGRLMVEGLGVLRVVAVEGRGWRRMER